MNASWSSPDSPQSKKRPRARARSPPRCLGSPSALASRSGSVFLPFADLGNYGWRISLVIVRAPWCSEPSSAVICGTRALRNAPRPVRAERPAARVFGSTYRALHAARARRVSHQCLHRAVITARQPLSHPDHDFSNSEIAGFRTVTAGVRVMASPGRAPFGESRPQTRHDHRLPRCLGVSDALLRRGRAPCYGSRRRSPRRRRLRRPCARRPRHRIVPHRGARHLERFPPRRGSRRFGGWGSWWRLSSTTTMGGLGPAVAICGIPTLIAAILARSPTPGDQGHASWTT